MLPQVNDRDAFTAAKEFGVGYQEPNEYVDIEVPNNSAIGPVLGGAGLALAFGLVWHLWWLVVLALLVALLTLDNR